MAAAYVPAMTVRGAASGAVAAASVMGKLGAGIGWCVGKPVSKVLSLSCKLINKGLSEKRQIDTKKLASRTVKVFQTAGALLSIAGLVDAITSGLTLPAKFAVCAFVPAIGAVGNTIRACKGQASFKRVYKELRDYGTSPTAKENLIGPFRKNLFSDIAHGDALGRGHSARLKKSAEKYEQQYLDLERKFLFDHTKSEETKSEEIKSEPLVSELSDSKLLFLGTLSSEPLSSEKESSEILSSDTELQTAKEELNTDYSSIPQETTSDYVTTPFDESTGFETEYYSSINSDS
ncbi:hypothetical protein EOPP23_00135 [Endozoicomonas sp. OPT23]|nr:hypothetical protein [Endozoicomonas sp. OPT23]